MDMVVGPLRVIRRKQIVRMRIHLHHQKKKEPEQSRESKARPTSFSEITLDGPHEASKLAKATTVDLHSTIKSLPLYTLLPIYPHLQHRRSDAKVKI